MSSRFILYIMLERTRFVNCKLPEYGNLVIDSSEGLTDNMFMASGNPPTATSPGEAILKYLEEYGWNQKDFADVLGIPAPKVNTLIKGKRQITLKVARELASVFGTEIGYWLNLDVTYRSNDLFGGNAVDEDLARRAKLFKSAPVNDMIRRRWIQNSDDIALLEKQVIAFYGASSVDDLATRIPHAARKSGSYLKETAGERFWMQRAKQMAAAVSVTRRFSDETFSSVMEQLKRLLGHPESVRQVPKLLADAGIRFVVVERLPQTRIDGVCLWLDKSSPVIALSLFYDRMDSFWFTLLHEMGHAKNRDGLTTPPNVDSRLIGDDAIPSSEKPEAERRADAFASASLIDSGEMDNFIARISPLYTKPRILGFAKRIGVHPAIVVGQLQQRQEIEWSHNRDLLAKVRDIMTQAALTDGWGQILPAVG
jgi:HTH-type transcriptional regulator/antitoxin HigA